MRLEDKKTVFSIFSIFRLVTAVPDPKEFQRFEQRPWEFFEISHGSYQPLNILPHLTLSTQYPIYIYRERETDRQTDRQTDKQTNRQTNKERE